MKNNFAFIDGQNLHFGIKSLGWKLDHKKFRAYLEKEHGVSKAYIFLGFMEEHQDLYNVLQEAGFICFFKPLVRYEDGTIKGNVDADMVLQVMIDIDKYDRAVIVSGDGDFSSLLRYLIHKDKLGQVLIPNREKYSSLFDRLDGFDENHVTYMNDLRSQLNYNVGRRPYKTNNRNSKLQTDNKKEQSRPIAKARASKPAKPAAKKPAPKKSQGKKQETSGFKPKAMLEKSLIDTINGNS
jgi:uncharacterized LabA/DUF88 family protein